MADSRQILETIARRYSPEIQEGLIKAFNKIRNLTTLNQLENIIKTRGIDELMLQLTGMEDIIGENIRNELEDAMTESGRASFQFMPKQSIINPNYSFSIFNPQAAEFIRSYELNLIQNISNNTRRAVRNAIQFDIISGRNPLDTARTFRSTIGLTENQEQAVRNYRRSLENLDRDALRRALRDKRFDSTVRRAIETKQALSEDQINKYVNRYRNKYIKFRSENIALTESLRVVSASTQLAIDDMVDSGAIDDTNVRKLWHYLPGARAAHVAIPKMNPKGVKLKEAFQTPLGPLRYPRDPNGTGANTIRCRCYLTYEIVEDEDAL